MTPDEHRHTPWLFGAGIAERVSLHAAMRPLRIDERLFPSAAVLGDGMRVFILLFPFFFSSLCLLSLATVRKPQSEEYTGRG